VCREVFGQDAFGRSSGAPRRRVRSGRIRTRRPRPEPRRAKIAGRSAAGNQPSGCSRSRLRTSSDPASRTPSKHTGRFSGTAASELCSLSMPRTQPAERRAPCRPSRQALANHIRQSIRIVTDEVSTRPKPPDARPAESPHTVSRCRAVRNTRARAEPTIASSEHVRARDRSIRQVEASPNIGHLSTLLPHGMVLVGLHSGRRAARHCRDDLQ
jgi:hypothetical protein